MGSTRSSVLLGAVLFLSPPATDAWAHWCDDIWSSGYNLVVRPDSDASPKALYVQNNMGYQLPNFKLTATSASGGAITLAAPTTLKVANTLLPGEKGMWRITSGNPAKVEDLTFSVTFGNTSGASSKQYACYPLAGASAAMIVKTDGSLYPATPTGLDDPKSPGNGCVGLVAGGTSLQYQAIADFEDLNVGLDKLLQNYCAGRASWGSTADAVSLTYCKDTSTTTCPASRPSSVGAVTDYVHLWSAGELAVRKGSLGARLSAFRERLQCGVNDGDMGFAGYALFVLGYLGDDAAAKSFLQTKVSAGGDLSTIAKAALYLMGDTAQKADVQAGVQSNSVFVKVACAAALGIVDQDDVSVTSAIIPEVKWNEPNLASEDGKGMYAVHMLKIVAFDRRGWIFKGIGDGAVTFYGETGGGAGGTSGTGGTSGAGGTSGIGGTSGTARTSGTGGTLGAGGTSGGGGATGNRDGGTDAASGGAAGTGGRSGGGGATAASGGSPSSGGSPGVGGATNNGGQGAGGETQGSGGVTGSGGAGVSSSGGGNRSGGSSGSGGSVTASGGNPTSSGGMAGGGEGQSSGCSCRLGGRPDGPALSLAAVAGLALLLVRRRWH